MSATFRHEWINNCQGAAKKKSKGIRKLNSGGSRWDTTGRAHTGAVTERQQQNGRPGKNDRSRWQIFLHPQVQRRLQQVGGCNHTN